jgi:hypothetical protein
MYSAEVTTWGFSQNPADLNDLSLAGLSLSFLSFLTQEGGQKEVNRDLLPRSHTLWT